jgi:hypothetical protein
MKRQFTLLFILLIIGLQVYAQTTTGKDMINGIERPVPPDAWGGDTVLSNGFRIFAIDIDGPPSMQRQWFVQFGRTVAYVHNISYDNSREAEKGATILLNGLTREFGEPVLMGNVIIWVTSDYKYRITMETQLDEPTSNGRTFFNSVRVEIQRFL